jgi:hypothetical protein
MHEEDYVYDYEYGYDEFFDSEVDRAPESKDVPKPPSKYEVMEMLQNNELTRVMTLMSRNTEGELDKALDSLHAVGIQPELTVVSLLRKIDPGHLGRLREHVSIRNYDEYNKTLRTIAGDTKSDIHSLIYDSKFVDPDLRVSITPRSADSKIILAPYQTKRIHEWMAEQTNYLKSNARISEIVRGYTFRGDRLVNDYIRGDVSRIGEIITAIHDLDTRYPPPLFPLAYQITDRYNELVVKGMVPEPKLEALFSDPTPGKEVLNPVKVRALFMKNYGFFKRRDILLPLINSFRKELNKIIKKSPKLGYELITFRGLKNENFLKPGTWSRVTKDFMSTSLSVKASSRFIKDSVYGTTFGMMMYEVVIPPEVPCLYVSEVSHFPHEQEVLLPHNLRLHIKLETVIKIMPGDVTDERNLLINFLDYSSGRNWSYPQIITRKVEVLGFGPFEEDMVVRTDKPFKPPTAGKRRKTRRKRRSKKSKTIKIRYDYSKRS